MAVGGISKATEGTTRRQSLGLPSPDLIRPNIVLKGVGRLWRVSASLGLTVGDPALPIIVAP